MASLIGHAIAAATIAKVSQIHINAKTIRLCIYCSILPDLDILAFKFGVPYEAPLGHRGFTHSIAFAFILGILIWAIFYKKHSFWKTILLFSLVTISHGLLDALTNGGKGVGFFIPFRNERYFFPWQVIEVSPIGRSFFGKSGLNVLYSELIWIAIPCIALLILWSLVKSFKGANYVKSR